MQNALWYTSIALEVVLLARLMHLQVSRYWPFAVMLVAMLTRDIVLMAIPLSSLKYTICWEVTLPLVLVAQVWAAWSCYFSITALYPKLGRVAQLLLGACLLCAILLSFAGLPLDTQSFEGQPITHALVGCYRWTESILAASLLLAVAFLSRFPAPARRLPANVLRHTGLLAAYFATYAISYLAPIARSADMVRMALICLLYAGWSLALTKRGEDLEAWPPLEEGIGRWIEKRNDCAEALYHQAAADSLSSRLQIRRAE